VETAPDANRLPSSNDAILKGLGRAGPSQPAAPSGEDVKPTVILQTPEEDLYDQYYARLAASSAPSSDTPGLISMGSDFGDDDEEEVKPTIQYLDSLNDYRKRSRSHDDVDGGSATPKMVKLSGQSELASVAVVMADESGMLTGGENGIVVSVAADDPTVFVNGQPVPFSQITEEHQELMTPEEYTAYYEVLARS